MSIIGSIIKAPFKLVGAGVKAGKNAIIPEGNKNSEIELVMKTPNNPQATEQYFDSLGNSSSYFKNYMIIWKPNTSEKSKTKIMNELKNIGI